MNVGREAAGVQDKSKFASTPDSAAPIVRRPLRAEVYKKRLTGIEQAVILAMLEIGDSIGQKLYIRIPRIAAWSKFDEKSVQRALWGDHRTHPGQPKPRGAKGKPEPECPFCKGLVQRRVLQQLAPANWKKRLPAVYRLNVEVLDDCEAVRRYLDQGKFDFPETKKPTVPLDPASHGRGVERPTVAGPASHGRGDQRPTVAGPASHGRTDSKAFDSETLDSTVTDTVKGEAIVIPARAREAESSPPLSRLTRGVLEKIAMPATPQNLATVGAALAAIQKRFDWPNPKCCEFLEERVLTAVKSGSVVNRFWFEDARYSQALNRSEAQELEFQRVREECNRISHEEAKREADARGGAKFADPNCQYCGGDGFTMGYAGLGVNKTAIKCRCRTEN